jgi:formate C-acetyltransferase
MTNAWRKFEQSSWTKSIDVREFIQKNYKLYEGDESFLAEATENTKELWNEVTKLYDIEIENGILDAETKVASNITSHAPGYVNKTLEKIVGFQTDKPLKRGIMPNGGIRVVKNALEAYGYKLDPITAEIYSKYRKTHNDGVFDAYTDQMRLARRSGIITGLPDAYGRGRIIGDYRRVALYGVEFLIIEKLKEKKQLDMDYMEESVIVLREELSEQIRALKDLVIMADSYGFDISKPAENAKEAIQWTYFGYLGAIKEQDGAAMSLGRVSTFLDIYIERDIKEGTLIEETAQELMDQFVMKLRMVRFLRTPSYNELFSGDPTWVTEVIGGVGVDSRPLVTKNSYRMLHTLYTLGPAPEPNLTVLWSERLPEAFKKYSAKVSIDTSSIQYENDDIMREPYGDDYGIACCVSAMKIGKQMQFFGARANMAKALLYAINGGIDEKSGEQIGPMLSPITSDVLSYDEVMVRFNQVLDWLAQLYINTLNIIHYMHDKYAYEKLQMSLHDKDVLRTSACGIAGLSVVADSLSAIKYSEVKVIRKDGLAVDYDVVEDSYPAYGNNDDRVDKIACDLVELFMNKLRKHKTYRDSVPTMSILTITSNVVYGKKTGSTPDGRKAGEPFAPGANPMHNRDTHGAISSLNSVAKFPYDYCLDGISNTFSTTTKTLGGTPEEQNKNLSTLLDSYFQKNGHHLNINVMNKETLVDAMEHPELYPQLTIRVSGYAVNFVKLTREQQQEVLSRTFFETM